MPRQRFAWRAQAPCLRLLKESRAARSSQFTTENGSLLVFDEVMTGFRISYGGAQEKFGVTPDLTTLGKVIGGGLPVGAYGGKKEIMSMIAPAGPVYQAGTLSGNPLAMTAGIKTLELLKQEGTYEKLELSTSRLIEGIMQSAENNGNSASDDELALTYASYLLGSIKVEIGDSYWCFCHKTQINHLDETSIKSNLKSNQIIVTYN